MLLCGVLGALPVSSPASSLAFLLLSTLAATPAAPVIGACADMPPPSSLQYIHAQTGVCAECCHHMKAFQLSCFSMEGGDHAI